MRIIVNVLAIFIAKAKCVELSLLPSNTNFYVYVVKEKYSCVKFNCSLKETKLSREADRNSSSVRQHRAVILFLTCKL